MDLYSYRIEVFRPASSERDVKTKLPNLTGFDVEASDGHIGKVDEATYEASGSWLVVDTGFWIFGKKRLIPAAVVSRVDPDDKKVFVNMTKEQIKNAPDYDADRNRSDRADYQREVGEYYEPYAGMG
jgi:hypothetical protein